MQRDLHNSILISRGISPAAAVTDNTAFVSEILDTANAAVNEFLGQLGALTDVNATFTVLMEESANSNMSSSNAVADADLLGTEAGAQFLFSDDNKTFKIGYIGSKRYIRLTITPAANDSGNIFLAGVWMQAGLRVVPKTTQIN